MTNYDNIPTVTQPQGLRINLFKHQLSSIYHMENLEREQVVEYEHGIKETRLGINADPTGYGKTLSMIGLIVRDKMEWNTELPFVQENIHIQSSGLVRIREIIRREKLNATLILVSPSIVLQWKKEFSHTELKVAIVACRRDVDNVDAENCDVVIVTTSMFNSLVMSYSKYIWKRFIFDEPGHVRVSGMKEVHAGFYWLVTATPDIINSYHRNCRGSFMQKIIGDNLNKFEEQFDGMILKNNIGFVKASFEMPLTKHHYYKCYQPVLQAISGMVSNTIHTMIAAGDIIGAITALGGKKTNNIIDLVRQEKIKEKTKIEEKIHIFSNIKNDDKKLKYLLEQKEHIDNQLEELDIRFKTMLKENCSICMEKLKNPVLEPSCHNLFCGQCLLKWLQQANKCPLCRTKVDITELIYFSVDISDTSFTELTRYEKKQYTQLECVANIIDKSQYKKFLIFSAYDASFKPICKLLKENDISFTEVKGTHITRQKSIDRFKNGDVQVIFLNSNFNGAGINLQEATDIILYHEMSPSTENQIIGRANRIGRTTPLHVHHLQAHI